MVWRPPNPRLAGSRPALRGGVAVMLLGSALASACNLLLDNEERSLASDLGPQPVRGPSDAAPGDGPSDGGSSCSKDLKTDPRNCGACGRDCLAGACSAGRCQPFTLAASQSAPRNLVVEQGVAYWLTGARSEVVASCPVAGCNGAPAQVVKVADTLAITGLAVRGSTVFVLTVATSGGGAGTLATCPTNGCATPTKIADTSAGPYSLVLDAANMFFLTQVPSVVRCPLPACAGGPVAIAQGGTSGWFEMIADDTSLYWWGTGPSMDITKSIVYRTSKLNDGGLPSTLLSSVPRPRLAVRGARLYVADNDGDAGAIYSVDLAGLNRTTVASAELRPQGIATDATDVYWAQGGADGGLRRCGLGGCDGGPTSVVDKQNDPASPLVTSTAIFWTEFGGGTVRGLAK